MPGRDVSRYATCTKAFHCGRCGAPVRKKDLYMRYQMVFEDAKDRGFKMCLICSLGFDTHQSRQMMDALHATRLQRRRRTVTKT